MVSAIYYKVCKDYQNKKSNYQNPVSFNESLSAEGSRVGLPVTMEEQVL